MTNNTIFFVVVAGAIFLYAANVGLDAPSQTTQKNVSLAGTLQTATVAVQDIATAEEAYFQKTGTYLQVKKDGTTVDGKVATTELKVDVVDYEMNIYTTPEGEKGFFIFVHTPNGLASYGYGVNAKDYTYMPPPPNIIPNTTSTVEATP